MVLSVLVGTPRSQKALDDEHSVSLVASPDLGEIKLEVFSAKFRRFGSNFSKQNKNLKEMLSHAGTIHEQSKKAIGHHVGHVGFSFYFVY